MKTQIELLKEYKIPVRGHLGQHLLIDPNVQKKIVDLLEIKSSEEIFEVGPGLGALTGEMLARGARVTAVEKDKNFCAILGKIYSDEISQGRFTLIQGDFLKVDFLELLIASSGKIKKAVSNIPYYITGPIIFKIFSAHHFLDQAVFMMQEEVAERIFAGPGSKAYGRISLSTRLYASPEHAFDVSRNCFTPPPEVKSAIVKFKFHKQAENLLKGTNEQAVLELIQTAFSQRRKKILTTLNGNPAYAKTRKEWLEIFSRRKISPDARPEELNLKDFIEIALELSPS